MPGQTGTLLALANKLLSRGPPSLSVLIAALGETEEYADFINLVREYLPEREVEILHEPSPQHQMAAFTSHFRDRYFPLEDGYFDIDDGQSYRDILYGIPVIVRGITYDDYHSMPYDWRFGFVLMTYLLEDPLDDGDARVPLAEACAEHGIPIALLRQVPERGISTVEAHRIFDDTLYRALALWADWVWGNTGNFFLDTDYEVISYNGCPPWDRETVEELTRQWQQAEVLDEEVINLSILIEEDPVARLEEILNLMAERRSSDTDKGAECPTVGAAGNAGGAAG